MNDDTKPLTLPAFLERLLVIPPLQLSDVTAFLISTEKPIALSSQFFDCLSANEIIQSERLASPDLRHRFLLGRAALRSILTALVGQTVPEATWCFDKSKNGKPYVQKPEAGTASFNLSYADYFIAIAVSNKVEVGLDIEVHHEIPEDELPLHLFSRDERRHLAAATKKDLPDAFLRLWTLKEAIAKRTGQGFAMEFSETNTLELSIVDGLNNVSDLAKTKTQLFHTRLNLLDKVIHLAVSTAPIAQGVRPLRMVPSE